MYSEDPETPTAGLKQCQLHGNTKDAYAQEAVGVHVESQKLLAHMLRTRKLLAHKFITKGARSYLQRCCNLPVTMLLCLCASGDEGTAIIQCLVILGAGSKLCESQMQTLQVAPPCVVFAQVLPVASRVGHALPCITASM